MVTAPPRPFELILAQSPRSTRIALAASAALPRFSDDQRRRLAAKAKKIGRDRLHQFASIVARQTLLSCRHRLVFVWFGVKLCDTDPYPLRPLVRSLLWANRQADQPNRRKGLGIESA